MDLQILVCNHNVSSIGSLSPSAGATKINFLTKEETRRSLSIRENAQEFGRPNINFHVTSHSVKDHFLPCHSSFINPIFFKLLVFRGKNKVKIGRCSFHWWSPPLAPPKFTFWSVSSFILLPFPSTLSCSQLRRELVNVFNGASVAQHRSGHHPSNLDESLIPFSTPRNLAFEHLSKNSSSVLPQPWAWPSVSSLASCVFSSISTLAVSHAHLDFILSNICPFCLITVILWRWSVSLGSSRHFHGQNYFPTNTSYYLISPFLSLPSRQSSFQRLW